MGVMRVYSATDSQWYIVGQGAILLDEDDMASDSATYGATQQSIKAYVDNKVGLPLLIESQNPSGVGSVDFTGFSSYDMIKIYCENVIPTADTDFAMLLSAAGTSYDTTTNYRYAAHISTDAASGAFSGSGAGIGTTYYCVAFYGNVGTDGTEYGVSAEINIYGNGLGVYTQITHIGHYQRGDGVWITATYGGGTWRNAGRVAGARFYFLGGNVESGRITAYGINHS